jgi:hypothetical protein
MYYTYAYLREDRTPYYIGKGQGNRISNRKKTDIKSPKDKSRVIFLKQNLTETEAFRHEIYMIAIFGRKDLGTGILHNRTDGGDGCSGLVHSPETKAKLSVANKGENHPFYGKTHSPETRAKLSAIQKGKTHSPETLAKMSAVQKGKTHSPETKAKISSSSKGKTFSSETREKISSATKGENNHNYGKMWITNEIINLMIYKNDIIPEGFRKGKTPVKLAQDAP